MERPGARRPYPRITESDETHKSTSKLPMATTRIVDLSIRLQLEENNDRLVYKAFKNLDHHSQSLNQSLSYISDTPLLVDLKVRKSNSNRSPRVELAI